MHVASFLRNKKRRLLFGILYSRCILSTIIVSFVTIPFPSKLWETSVSHECMCLFLHKMRANLSFLLTDQSNCAGLSSAFREISLVILVREFLFVKSEYRNIFKILTGGVLTSEWGSCTLSRDTFISGYMISTKKLTIQKIENK